MDNSRRVVTIGMADTPKLKLRICDKFKCELFEACKKYAQNVWEGQKCAKTTIFDNFLGGWLP